MKPPNWKCLDRPRLPRRLVGQRHRFEILDLRIVAVAGADAVAPGAGVERFGVVPGFSHIDAAGDAAFFPADELLAHETFGFEEIRRDFAEMLAAFLKPDRWRQVVENNGSNHRRSSLCCFRRYQAGFADRLRRRPDRPTDLAS
jgi:hypothetical protein